MSAMFDRLRGCARRAGLPPLLLATTLLAGCANPFAMGVTSLGRGNAPFLAGPGITQNRTPLDDALGCYGMALRRSARTTGIAVGEVRDFTGRVTETDGAQITQGGGLMVYSALGKLGGAIRIHERLDPRIAEVELIYMDRRQLGDGRRHRAQVGQQQQDVPWIPYFGGSIARSDYFIVGGITELNQVVSSGGFEAGVNLVGGRARTFTINVAVDLRIVNTTNLVVARTVTLQKQIVGYEVGIDIFRFFGSRLVDVNAGIRSLEPVQLAVRAVLELATMELVDAVTGVDHRSCLPPLLLDAPEASGSDPGGEAEAARRVQQEPVAAASGRVSPVAPAAAPAPSPARAPGGTPAPSPAQAVTPPAPAMSRPQAPVPEGRVSPPLTPRPRPGAAAPAPATPVAAAPAAARSVAEASAAAPPAPAGGGERSGGPAVVLASMDSETGARRAWAQARGKGGDLLAGRAAEIRQVRVSDRQLWLVLVPLPRESDPAQLCQALQSRGTACVVAPPSLQRPA